MVVNFMFLVNPALKCNTCGYETPSELIMLNHIKDLHKASAILTPPVSPVYDDKDAEPSAITQTVVAGRDERKTETPADNNTVEKQVISSHADSVVKKEVLPVIKQEIEVEAAPAADISSRPVSPHTKATQPGKLL